MKTKTRKELKSLKYYLEKMTKKQLEEKYSDYLSIDEEIKKGTKEEIVEYLYEAITSEYSLINIVLEQEQVEEMKKDFQKENLENIDEEYIENQFVFKTENGYEVPEELIKVLNNENTLELDKHNKGIMFLYYVMINGLIEIDKMVDLMKQSGLKITKKEVKEYAKENDFMIDKDIIYFNILAKELNKNNDLINQKNEYDYKVSTIKDALITMSIIGENNLLEEIEMFLRKKTKKIECLKEISEMIFNILLVSQDFEETIEEVVIKQANIKLTKKDKKNFFELLNEICFQIPSWTLNGYSPMEQEIDLNDEYDDCYCDFCSEHNHLFESLSKDEKIEAYINVYLIINGIIEIDKLVEIINNNHNLKVTKKELIKIANQIEETYIIDNYLSVGDFDEEMISYIKLLKLRNDYYIIEDIDEVYEENIIMTSEIEELLTYYKLNDDVIGDIFMGLNTGTFSEEYLEFILRQNNFKMPLKKQKQLLDDMKPYIRDYRNWCLNGFKPSELNKLVIKEKIGRNDLCSCGSGKKYKKCCGK